MFLKQTLGWMLHGELCDPSGEYFIVGNAHAETEPLTKSHAEPPFNWAQSYSLRLQRVPESHISPRTAAKVMFAGKAVRLLKLAGAGDGDRFGGDGDENDSDVLEYFGGRVMPRQRRGEQSVPGKEDKGQSIFSLSGLQAHTIKAATAKSSFSHSSVHSRGQDNDMSDTFDVDGFLTDTLSAHCASNGFKSLEEFYGFAAQFQEILLKPDLAVELLERLIDDVHDLVSYRLWAVMRDEYDCFRCLHVLRNSFFVGKGEFFQNILDEVLILVQSAVPVDAQQANMLLQHSVMRKVGRKLNIDLGDDEERSSNMRGMMFKLQVMSENMSIGSQEFEGLLQEGAVLLLGSTTLLAFDAAIASSRKDGMSKIDLAGNRPTGRKFVRLGMACPLDDRRVRAEKCAKHFTTFNTESKSNVAEDNSGNGVGNNSSGGSEYNFGSLQLSEERSVTKGFNFSVTFACAWNAVASVGPSHPMLTPSSYSSRGEVLLGGISCVVGGGSGGGNQGRNWKYVNASSSTLGEGTKSRMYQMKQDMASLGLLSPNSLTVGVSLYGKRYVILILILTLTLTVSM